LGASEIVDYITKAHEVAEFFQTHEDNEEYADFFDHNDVGVPLSVSIALGQATLTEEGNQVVEYTWLKLIELLGANPDVESRGVENDTSSASESGEVSADNLNHQTSIKEKINIIDQFVSEYIDQDQFMEDNARGIALAEAFWQELVDLTESGASIVNETWMNLCALFGVDPAEEYLELADLEDEEV
jgi:hypothetical protein